MVAIVSILQTFDSKVTIIVFFYPQVILSLK